MKVKAIKAAALAAIIGYASAAGYGAAQSFDFRDPKGVNNVQFKLDAPLESISGTGTGISGFVEFDSDDPSAISGSIVLDAKSLLVGNPKMVEHLHGAYWLDVETYPTIEFKADKISNLRTTGVKSTADVSGELTVKGISKRITVPVTLTYLEGKLGARMNDESIKGDLLVLRSQFSIDREDFGIQVGEYLDKVSRTIELSLSIAGAAPKS